jgi:hypothetical protein
LAYTPEQLSIFVAPDGQSPLLLVLSSFTVRPWLSSNGDVKTSAGPNRETPGSAAAFLVAADCGFAVSCAAGFAGLATEPVAAVCAEAVPAQTARDKSSQCRVVVRCPKDLCMTIPHDLGR